MKKSSNSYVRKGIVIGVVSSLFLFTGCSSKSPSSYSSVDINKFYKETSNTKINNSKSMHKYTLRPYNVFGINYIPFVANIGDKFSGIASWYGPDFHANKTSNGEIYNMYALTAAHKTLPMNTMVKVDNLENGKSVIVRINDRGPFVKGRIIDLSNKAAHAIDMVRKGTAKVKVTVLGYNGEIENNQAPHEMLPKKEEVRVATVTKKPIGEPVKVVVTQTQNTQVEPLDIKETVVVQDNYSIQVGAYSKEEGALKTKNDYQRQFSNNLVEAKKILSNGRYLFKVFIKGFSTRTQAQNFKDENGLNSAMIVSN